MTAVISPIAHRRIVYEWEDTVPKMAARIKCLEDALREISELGDLRADEAAVIAKKALEG